MGSGPLFGESLQLEAHWPLRWWPLEQPPDDSVLASDAYDGERLLALIAIEESIGDSSDDQQPPSQRLNQIEARLGLLLELVNELIRRSSPPPPLTRLRLDPQAIEWHDPAHQTELAPATLVAIELYPCSSVARPLRLTAELAEVDDGRLAGRLIGISGGLADQLHKLIFRSHRRAIARRRSGE